MAETSFAVTFAGPAVDDGRMDVADLAPALLALAGLVKEANVTLHPDDPPVTLEVQATTRGSFLVEMIMTQPDMAARVVELFSSDAITALVNLKELLFTTGGGLLGLIAWIRRRRVVNLGNAPQPGFVTVTMEDGTSITVPEQTWRLYRRVEIRRTAAKVVTPLHRDGIEELVISSAETSELRLTQDDAESFAIAEEIEEPIAQATLDMAVSIASVAFTEGNKWRLSDGERIFYAAMDDADFQTQIDRGEVAFRKGDILRCEMRIRQVRTEAGLSTEYTVLRVDEHIPAAQPLRLPLLDPGGPATPDADG
jgi:hypothetical protein